MSIQHIIPAIIPDSFEQLQSRLREVKGVAQRVQIDVMDGSYTQTQSWPYSGVEREAFEAIRREDQGLPYWQDFDFEIDLLLLKPEERVLEWALAGAACLVVHVETTQKIHEIAQKCFDRRLEMGLAIKPSSSLEILAPYLDRASFVQVMGSDRLGRYGVTLDERVVHVISNIKERWPQIIVGVDIGVTPETLPVLCKAGASRFASGSSIFQFSTPSGALLYMERIVQDFFPETNRSSEV